ncbi:MAG: aminotransferase class I/II-fold pyridoxal phosphate-dependent enzyme [Alphaproteobacteria bacterium]|jgi:aspartate/methionine/tyrosine aminotransferase|nr:aminotransferase class I/II-fold pyridoxal phosphate-dependent enzyme [Alphaproteobacteria bacterium]
MLIPARGMQSIGTETAFEVLARAQALAAQGRDIVNLGIGQPDFKTAPHIVEAACQALRDGHHGYTPAKGILPLRQAVARDLDRRYGAAVDAEHILIVPGGKVTIWFAILMFGEPDNEILYPDPGFPVYESAIGFTGATPVRIPLREENGFAFSADDVLARLSPWSRLLILNSPANPTGGVASRAELDTLAEGLKRFPQVAILSDEIYSAMLYDGRAHVSLLDYPHLRDRVILLDGWSKTYAMTGWRLGYGVWPERLIEGATKLAINSHSCVNAAAQYAGIAALEGPQEATAAMLDTFATRRRLIVDGLNDLPGVRCVEPGGAFYAFPNITGTGFSSAALQRRLLEEAGVAVIAGTSFGREGEGFLRFSYAASTDAIAEGLARIRRFLESAA